MADNSCILWWYVVIMMQRLINVSPLSAYAADIAQTYQFLYETIAIDSAQTCPAEYASSRAANQHILICLCTS